MLGCDGVASAVRAALQKQGAQAQQTRYKAWIESARRSMKPVASIGLRISRSPSSALSPFIGGGFRYKIDYRKRVHFF